MARIVFLKTFHLGPIFPFSRSGSSFARERFLSLPRHEIIGSFPSLPHSHRLNRARDSLFLVFFFFSIFSPFVRGTSTHNACRHTYGNNVIFSDRPCSSTRERANPPLTRNYYTLITTAFNSRFIITRSFESPFRTTTGCLARFPNNHDYISIERNKQCGSLGIADRCCTLFVVFFLFFVIFLSNSYAFLARD